MPLKNEFQKFIGFHVRRILTQLDRDPDSPTAGCFDRVYWHYKARDYSSAILQQSVHVLESARRGDIETDLSAQQAARLTKTAVAGLTRQINGQGGVNEYYPFENSYVAGAFALYAVCRVLLDWQETAPHLLEGIDFPALQRLVDHMQNRREHRQNGRSGMYRGTTPACQHATALAALTIAGELEPLKVSKEVVSSNLQRLLEGQSSEGWFDEYGGPDFGYLSVTMDALADIHRITRADAVFSALERAVDFVARTVGPDGKIPFELGSRNTEYFYPYGLAYAARTNQAASWLLHTAFRDMNSPRHFLWSIDDRYMAHCTLASIVKSLPYLPGAAEPKRPPGKESIWMPGSGLWLEHRADYTLAVSSRKGGIVRVARSNAAPLVDHGFRARAKNRKWTNNWWSSSLEVTKEEGKIVISGSCRRLVYDLPSPALHLGLRALAFLFRHRLKPFLKKVMILREGEEKGGAPRFTRTITLGADDVLEIRDVIAGKGEMEAVAAPRQNLRYVPSANNFCDEECIPALVYGEEATRGQDRLERQVRVRVRD